MGRGGGGEGGAWGEGGEGGKCGEGDGGGKVLNCTTMKTPVADVVHVTVLALLL